MNEKWIKIENEYGADMAEALKALYEYYEGEKIADWIVSLFDPATGGFYYCVSARDTEGYLPDIESSQQVFGILANLGAIPLAKRHLLPNDLKRRLVTFARELQSPVDGYFYHPQWPQDKNLLATDRYGRDNGQACTIIERFPYDDNGDGIDEVQYPKYCTPTGKKCALHEGTDECCKFPIAGVAAPQKTETAPTPEVTSVGGNHPCYDSREAFSAWLEEYNSGMKVNSGNAHNLAAISREIANQGYMDILLDHICDKQRELFDEQVANGETPTGIWQRDYNYRAVWGCYKYLHIMNENGRALDIKYAPYMIEACRRVIELPPDGKYAYNDLMNQWSAINGVIGNIKKHYGDEAAAPLYDIIRRDPVSLVRNSLEKMRPFKQEDGSFSNRVDGVTTPVIYGSPIAVGGLHEGNVNSTHILVCMYASICAALGVPRVPPCTESTGDRVIEALCTKPPLKKKA